jgi:hypothetical protein
MAAPQHEGSVLRRRQRLRRRRRLGRRARGIIVFCERFCLFLLYHEIGPGPGKEKKQTRDGNLCGRTDIFFHLIFCYGNGPRETKKLMDQLTGSKW